ncbi:MAG TPA: gamma-glutamyl-phosphate reductase, partial [Ruminococcus sp.]|nr:gamma-glutamyl-phosphate reductase [Ruminococcus sp.]
MSYIEELGKKAKAAKRVAACTSTAMKNNALAAIADALTEKTELIISQNKLDLENAVKNNMSAAMQDRLMLNEQRIKGISDSVRKLIELEDIIGSVDSGVIRPNGLKICKTRVPLGAIGIIFESRPNVTVDAGTLCLKAGNAVILRGGKEAINSNKCLVGIMREAIESAGMPADTIQLVEDTSRETSTAMMKMNEYLDVLIPRGGAGLI